MIFFEMHNFHALMKSTIETQHKNSRERSESERPGRMPRPAAVVIKTLQQEKEEEERPGDMGHGIVRHRLATQFRRKLPSERLCADLRCDMLMLHCCWRV